MRDLAHSSQIRSVYIMKMPEWTKPALLGAGVGAIAISIAGFNWGGWVTGGSAAEMSNDQSVEAVTLALTPYCLAQAESDPAAATVMADLAEASSFRRHVVIQEAGWATPLGAESPNRALADACQEALEAAS